MKQEGSVRNIKSKSLFVAFTFLILVMMGAGAKDLTRDVLLHQKNATSAYDRSVERWVSQITTELPERNRRKWQRFVRERPGILIKACSRENNEVADTDSDL